MQKALFPAFFWVQSDIGKGFPGRGIRILFDSVKAEFPSREEATPILQVPEIHALCAVPVTLVDETCHQPLIIRFPAAPQCEKALSALFERFLRKFVSPVLVLGLAAARVRKIAYLAEDESRGRCYRPRGAPCAAPNRISEGSLALFPLPISRRVPARMRTM